MSLFMYSFAIHLRGVVFTNPIYYSTFIFRIPTFWLADFCRVILGCDETTSLSSFLYCNSRGVNSTHYCHYTMALADLKFDDFWDADIDSLINDAIPKNTKKATAWGIRVWEVWLRISIFFSQASWCVSACFQQYKFSVFSLINKNINALIARELSAFTCTRSQTMNSKCSIPDLAKSRAVLKSLVHS